MCKYKDSDVDIQAIFHISIITVPTPFWQVLYLFISDQKASFTKANMPTKK